jgi:hypothetical protein
MAMVLRSGINFQRGGQRKHRRPAGGCDEIGKEQFQPIVPYRFTGPNLRNIFITKAALFYHVPWAFVLGEGMIGEIGPF